MTTAVIARPSHRRKLPEPSPAVATGPDPVLAHLQHMSLRGMAPSTIDARRRALARMTAQLPVPLLQASYGHLLAWRTAFNLAPDTIGDYVSHAHQFYAWALSERLIGANPAEAIPIPPSVRRLPRPIPDRDLFSALAGAPPRVRPWLVLAGWAGLRAKEIALLRRESILEHARPPVLIVAADATKGNRERAVPLVPFVIDELHRAGLPSAGWVFRRADGRPGPNQPGNVSRLPRSRGIRHRLPRSRAGATVPQPAPSCPTRVSPVFPGLGIQPTANPHGRPPSSWPGLSLPHAHIFFCSPSCGATRSLNPCGDVTSSRMDGFDPRSLR